MLSGCHGFNVGIAFNIYVLVLFCIVFIIIIFIIIIVIFSISYIYIYIYIFCSQVYHNTYICMPSDCKFFRLIYVDINIYIYIYIYIYHYTSVINYISVPHQLSLIVEPSLWKSGQYMVN